MLAWDPPPSRDFHLDSLKLTWRSLPHWVIRRKCLWVELWVIRPWEGAHWKHFLLPYSPPNPCFWSLHTAPFNYPHSCLSWGNCPNLGSPWNSGSHQRPRPLIPHYTHGCTFPLQWPFSATAVSSHLISYPSSKQSPLPTAMIPSNRPFGFPPDVVQMCLLDNSAVH